MTDALSNANAFLNWGKPITVVQNEGTSDKGWPDAFEEQTGIPADLDATPIDELTYRNRHGPYRVPRFKPLVQEMTTGDIEVFIANVEDLLNRASDEELNAKIEESLDQKTAERRSYTFRDFVSEYAAPVFLCLLSGGALTALCYATYNLWRG